MPNQPKPNEAMRAAWFALHDQNGEPLGGFRNEEAAKRAQARFPGSKITKLNLTVSSHASR